MVKKSARTSKTIKKSTSARKIGGAKKIVVSRDMDEIKLGEFDSCEPMRLPEVLPRRIWQILGAVVLMLMAVFCVATMVAEFPFAYLWRQETDVLWSPGLTPLTLSWIVNNVALVVFTVVCVVTSILLFVKKRVPVGMWYVLILTLLIGFISQSISIYTNYTVVDCNVEPCPLVVGELSTVLLCDIVVLMIGIVLLWMVYRTNLHYGKLSAKRKR